MTTPPAVSPAGLITAKNRGEAFVMARFATFTVGCQTIVVPKDLKYEWPAVAEHNYIDALVHANFAGSRFCLRASVTTARLSAAFISTSSACCLRASNIRISFSTADPNKRARLVDELLARKEFVELWVMKWPSS
jgi:hypothetical protein